MYDNKIRLFVNGKAYDFWEEASIVSALDAVSMSFDLTVTANHEANASSLLPFSVGDHVEIFIDTDLVLTGYIDKTPFDYSATSASAKVSGHAKTVDLIDCTVMLDNIQFKNEDVKSWTNTPKKNKTTINAPDVYGISWRKQKLGVIIAQLINPYNIKLVVEGNVQSKLDKVMNFDATPTDTVLKTIQNLTKNENLLFYCDEEGDLVVGEKGIKSATDELVLGGKEGNILTGHADFDGTKLFKYYRIQGQTKGNNQNFGKSICNINQTATDPFIKRVRLKTEKEKGQASSSNCKNQADGEMNYQEALFNKVTYKVQGWRQKDGSLWKINSLVKIHDSFLGIDTDQSDNFLITKVTFNLSNSGGTTTTLEVVPPEGFRIEINGSESQKQQTSNTSSQSNLSWINK